MLDDGSDHAMGLLHTAHNFGRSELPLGGARRHDSGDPAGDPVRGYVLELRLLQQSAALATNRCLSNCFLQPLSEDTFRVGRASRHVRLFSIIQSEAITIFKQL